MKKYWSTLVVASFGVCCATGCMTPNVSSTYDPTPGGAGMRAYGTSGCLDVEALKSTQTPTSVAAKPATYQEQRSVSYQPVVTTSSQWTTADQTISEPLRSSTASLSSRSEEQYGAWREISN